MALEIAFGAMLLIVERQAKDQLPGGRYWNMSQAVKDKTAGVPTTNAVR
jgi:E1A/CREB-binding protein